MMDQMIIQVEEQQPPDNTGFIEGRSRLWQAFGAVLEEGADFGQTERRITHRQNKIQRR
ncbi:hypothetical protein D3C80_2231390 [compost metagenome]